MKSIGVLLNLLHHFHRGIQCDKTCNFVHGKAFEVHHEMPILDVELKRHTKSITNVQFWSNVLSISSVFHQSCAFDDIVNFYKSLKMLIHRVF